MKIFLASLFIQFITFLSASAQCSLQTLLPNADSLFYDGFATSFDIDGDYMVVGVPNYNYFRGRAYVFEKSAGTWQLVATLSPSDSIDYRYFGQDVEIEGDLIVVSRNLNEEWPSGIKMPFYVFQKPVTGDWADAHESSRLYPIEADSVYGYNFDADISLFKNTLAITSHYSILLYEFSNDLFSHTATLICADQDRRYKAPKVEIRDQFLVASTSTSMANDKILIFKKPASGWIDKQQDLEISPVSQYDNEDIHFGQHLVVTEQEIFIDFHSGYYQNSESHFEQGVFVFENEDGSWGSSKQIARLNLEIDRIEIHGLSLAKQGDYLFVKPRMNNSEMYIYKKPLGAWEDSDAYWTIVLDELQEKDRFLVRSSSGSVFISSNLLSENSGTSKILQFDEPVAGWENIAEPDQIISHAEIGAADDRFGGTIDIHKDIMIVGANGDDSNGNFTGCVYVFQYQNEKWIKLARLRPSDGRALDNFGVKAAIHDNYIVVGSSGADSIDENGGEIFYKVGAAYIFKKPETGWEDAFEDQKLRPPLVEGENYFGYDVDISSNTLAVSEYYEGSSESKGKVHIYELNNASERWEYRAVLRTAADTKGDSFGRSLSINDSVVVVGSGRTRMSGFLYSFVYVYQKDGDHWIDAYETARLQPEVHQSGSLFGYKVFLHRNKILVGAPGYKNEDLAVGRLFLFENNGITWENMNESASFYANQGVDKESLGYSIYMNDDFVISGATLGSMSQQYEDQPYGKAYLFSNKNGVWETSKESQIILSGEMTFGSDVAIYDEKAIVGSWHDDTENGVGSGSVKIFPITYVEAPEAACVKSDLDIELEGFPLGGQWSGTGIINTSLGYFNPSNAGTGEHIIKYTINQCTYSQALIKVLGDIEQPFADESNYFCEKDTFNISTDIEDANYQWFFGTDAHSLDTISGATENHFKNNQAGFYSVNIKTLCSSAYDTIQMMSYELKIDSIPVLCAHQSVEISAYPHGGSWYGNAIDQSLGIFNTDISGFGWHEIMYGVPGCSYLDTARVLVQQAPASVSYLESEKYVCGDSLTINLQSSASNNNISWYWSENNSDFAHYAEATQSAPVVNPGKLMVEVYNYCGSVTDTMIIKKVELELEDSLQLCENDTPITLEANPSGGYWTYNGSRTNARIDPKIFSNGSNQVVYNYEIDQCTYRDTIHILQIANPNISFDKDLYEYCSSGEFIVEPSVSLNNLELDWFFKKDVNSGESWQLITEGNQLINPESGYYKVETQNNTCIGISEPIFVQKNQPDSLFIPNIITPNHDGFNDYLQIYSEYIIEPDFSIFDRYGKLVLNTNNISSPIDLSKRSGVLYYYLKYTDLCQKEPQSIKGYLHVLK